MNVESSLLKCESALDKLANFLERHRAIFDVCMVDFVTKNIFESVLQPGLQEDLLKCTDKDLIRMPSKLIQNEKISTFRYLFTFGLDFSVVPIFYCLHRDNDTVFS